MVPHPQPATTDFRGVHSSGESRKVHHARVQQLLRQCACGIAPPLFDPAGPIPQRTPCKLIFESLARISFTHRG